MFFLTWLTAQGGLSAVNCMGTWSVALCVQYVLNDLVDVAGRLVGGELYGSWSMALCARSTDRMYSIIWLTAQGGWLAVNCMGSWSMALCVRTVCTQ